MKTPRPTVSRKALLSVRLGPHHTLHVLPSRVWWFWGYWDSAFFKFYGAGPLGFVQAERP